jgi:hypothetical protein
MKSTTGLLKWKLPSLILKGTLILIFIIGLLLHIASFIPFQNSPKDHDFPISNTLLVVDTSAARSKRKPVDRLLPDFSTSFEIVLIFFSLLLLRLPS